MAVTTGDLRPSSGLGAWRTPLVIVICGCAIALHQAVASQKRGSEIKLVFGVADVRAFKAERAAAKAGKPASRRKKPVMQDLPTLPGLDSQSNKTSKAK